MKRTMKRLDEIEIPPYVQKEMGLKKDWKKQISPAFAESVVKTAEKYKSALRRLSKN